MNKIDELTKNPDRRAFLKYLLGGAAIGIPAMTLLQGCGMPNDPLETMYTKDLLAGIKDTYRVGTETYRYLEGHFKKLYVNGVEYTGSGSVSPEDIEMAVLGTPTYSNLQDFANSFGSTGRKTGGVISDAGGGFIAITAGTGFIKATDDDNAELMFFDFPAPANIEIPADSTRYIGVEYNSGTPQVVARESWNWNLDSEFPLGRVVNETINGSSEIYIINNPWWVTDGMTNVLERVRAIGRIVRDNTIGGLILSVTGTRSIAVTAGMIWANLNEFAIAALDTNVSGTFEYYWYDSVDGWQVSDETQYSVTQWNDITQETLQTIDNNKYCNLWVYVEADGLSIACIYPQAQYNTAAAAEAASAPTIIPSHIAQNGLLIGKVVFKQNVDVPAAVKSAFSTVFTGSLATDHNNLASLQGGTSGEYYHLTSAEYAGASNSMLWAIVFGG